MDNEFSFNNISDNATLYFDTSPQENPQGNFVASEAIVSNAVHDWFMNELDTGITAGVAYIGLIVNIVTIIIFYKQGYKETINISLTAIAIWDLIKCITGVVFRIHGPAKLVSAAFQLTYYSFGVYICYTATFSTYVSAVLAGYVAVERCLCVSLPFTVKFLLTPKVVTSVNIILSVIVFGSFCILFVMHKIVWIHHPVLNTTIALYTYSAAYFKYPKMLTYFNAIGFIWPSLSLVVMCSCTVIIAYHLRKASKFRSDNLGQCKVDNYKEFSNRDRHVIRILLVIIVIYMMNIFPRLGVALTKSIVPGFYLHQYYHNLFIVCIAIEFLFDFINAAINPFIYFFMSSQYRDSFKELFCCRQKNGRRG